MGVLALPSRRLALFNARGIVQSLAFVLTSILAIAPSHAIEPICALDVTLEDADFENSGGQTSDVDTTAKTVRVRAEGGAAGSENSAHGELGFRFHSTVTMPALVTLSGILAQGRLEGFGNINEGSIRIRAILRDLTTDDELGSIVILDKSQDGDPFTKIIEPVNELFLPSPQFDVTLTDGHDYVALIRVDVKANGLLGLSDFHNGGRKVTLGATAIAPKLADQDGDGLFDVWETSGIDLDCDAANGIDLNLPGMGANPNHKDLFLEVDWLPGAEPSRAGILAIKAAFAASPKDSGGVANPDGTDGINFWLDTGDLIDAAAPEDGSGQNSCGDGVDNGADGLADINDPDCLVGDLAFSSLVGGGNLGDGRALPAANISDLGTDADNDGVTQFYEARDGNFRLDRRLAFRYAISGPKVGSLLGEAEFHGNDFVFFKPPESSDCTAGSGLFPVGTHAAALMHELGHTLGLRHGGDADTPQREPNYVSVMNYAFGFGIQQVDNATSQDFNLDGEPDCRILDYSAPRRPAGRGAAPLPSLNEQALDETKRLDPTDAANFSARFDPALAQWIDMRLDQRPDWDGDGIPNEMTSQANINNDKTNAMSPAPILSTALNGWDDWKGVMLSLRGIEDSDDGPRNNLVVASEKDDADEMLNIYRQTSETDLEIAKTVQSGFLVAGQPLTYRLTVTNKGPNRSPGAKLVDDLPSQATLLATPVNCALPGDGDIACEIGALDPGQSVAIDIQLRPALGLDCKGAQFAPIANKATVTGRTGDPQEGNNTAWVETNILCVAYEYSAKFACGEQAQWPGDPLTRGLYGTSINIHNPNDETVHFFKKLAFAYPPSEQRPGPVLPLGVDALDYDQALKTACAEIQKQGASNDPASFVEGFLVIQGPRSLDVTGVYTVTTAQTSLHIEQVRERQRKAAEPASPDDSHTRADLVPLRAACLPPATTPRTVRVVVRNEGLGDAAPSQAIASFGPAGRLTAQTPALPAGTQMTLDMLIPTACPQECPFEVRVDGKEEIEETDESNNIRTGACLPSPG